MAKISTKKPAVKIDDEPGAADRFLSGVRKALETPHKPHKAGDKAKKGKKNAGG